MTQTFDLNVAEMTRSGGTALESRSAKPAKKDQTVFSGLSGLLREGDVELARGTLAASYDGLLRRMTADRTNAAAEPHPRGWLLLPAEEDEEPVTAATIARDNRLALLARKYGAGATPEDEGRLMILTQRLRALAPHVTEDDVTRLEQARGLMASADATVAELRERYGLR